LDKLKTKKHKTLKALSVIHKGSVKLQLL